MGTQGSGRKRAPLKDRFSAEDEALSSIAREVGSYSITFTLSFHFGANWNGSGLYSPYIAPVVHCLINANMIVSNSNCLVYPHLDNGLVKHRLEIDSSISDVNFGSSTITFKIQGAFIDH